MNLRRSVKGIVSLIAAVLALYLAGYFLIGRSFVPAEFSEARRESAAVAREINQMINESLGSLEEISLQDRERNFKQALVLVREELGRAQQARLKAIELVVGLGKMSKSAQEIEPAKARDLAVEAIGSELTSLSHLVVYNDILNGLLQTLELKFSGDLGAEAEDVQNLIKSLNAEAKEINDLNTLFNQKMQEFDNLVG